MITFSGKTIFLDGRSVVVEYSVEEAFELQDLIIVLFDPDAYTEKFGQFPNLIAIDATGKRRWTAELPTTTSMDRYYKIASRMPLVAYSFSSNECEIDPKSGRIKASRFYK